MARLRRASLPPSGETVSLSCHEAAFPGAIFFLVYAIQKAFSATPAKVIFLVITDALRMMVWSDGSRLLNFDTPNCLRGNIS